MTMTGHVKTVVKDRGFGFIRTDGPDFFFHSSDLTGGVTAFYGLAEGDAVSFEPVEPPPPKWATRQRRREAADARRGARMIRWLEGRTVFATADAWLAVDGVATFVAEGEGFNDRSRIVKLWPDMFSTEEAI